VYVDPNFKNSFTLAFSKEFAINSYYVSHHTLLIFIHYLAKLKMPHLPFFHYSYYKNVYQNSFISLS